MDDARSNYPEVRAAIRAVAQSWDFRGRGRWTTLGDDALETVAQWVYDRTFLGQKDPDGLPLAPLKPATLEKKRRLGYPDTIGVETGKMGDYREIRGERTVNRRWCRMEFGTGEDTRQKAEWFSEGDPPAQAPRPFYELDGDAEAALDALFEEVLDRNLRELQG